MYVHELCDELEGITSTPQEAQQRSSWGANRRRDVLRQAAASVLRGVQVAGRSVGQRGVVHHGTFIQRATGSRSRPCHPSASSLERRPASQTASSTQNEVRSSTVLAGVLPQERYGGQETKEGRPSACKPRQSRGLLARGATRSARATGTSRLANRPGRPRGSPWECFGGGESSPTPSKARLWS